MNCIECKAANPENSRFCGQCGAEVGRTLDETIRKKGFRDRQATEMEITDAVVARLLKWVTWLGSTTAVIVALFAIMLGWTYHDVRDVVALGMGQIQSAVTDGKSDLDTARQSISDLKAQIAGVKSDVDQYKQVNSRIDNLQRKLTNVDNNVVDLGNRSLRARTLETTGPGPSSYSFRNLGCSPSVLAVGAKVAYCAEGSPPVLFQRSSAGDLRPVAGVSTSGFQDISTTEKRACTAASRGTLYVEKGAGSVSDRPFLCARTSDSTYEWIQLATVR